MPPKIWLLDFDGVINAFGRGGRSGWTDYETTIINGFTITYSPSVIACIREAVEAGVDVRWLSTWCADTTMFPHHIPGMPEFPWLDSNGGVDADGWSSISWKAEAAQQYVPDDADLLWTEDERYVTSVCAGDWVDARTGPTVVINPVPHIGLSPTQVTSIREWFLTEKAVPPAALAEAPSV